MGDLSTAGSNGAAVLQGLEQASRGGISGIVGITTATRGFIGLIKGAITASGPLGIFITTIGLAAGALAIFKTRTKETGDSQQKLAEGLKKTVAAASELEKVRLDALKKDLDDTATKESRHNKLTDLDDYDLRCACNTRAHLRRSK